VCVCVCVCVRVLACVYGGIRGGMTHSLPDSLLLIAFTRDLISVNTTRTH